MEAEIPQSSRGDDRDRVPGHQHGRGYGDPGAGLDPGYPQRRQKIEREEGRICSPGTGDEHPEERAVHRHAYEPLPQEDRRPAQDQNYPEEERETRGQVGDFHPR